MIRLSSTGLGHYNFWVYLKMFITSKLKRSHRNSLDWINVYKCILGVFLNLFYLFYNYHITILSELNSTTEL